MYRVSDIQEMTGFPLLHPFNNYIHKRGLLNTVFFSEPIHWVFG